MIKPDNLDPKIREVVEQYKKEGEVWEVFPAKFFVDGAHYYYFYFDPAEELMVIRDDGAVLPVSQIRRVALIADGYNTSITILANYGENWASKPIVTIYRSYLRALKKIKKYAVYMPREFKKELDGIISLSREVIDHQITIRKAVNAGRRLTVKTRKREIVTEEDFKKMRGYHMTLVRCGFRQNEIELETSEVRERLIQYLETQISWKNWWLWFPYRALEHHDQRMYSKKRDPEEVKMMEELRKEIDKDLPIEQHPDVEKYFAKLRNPRP